MPDINWGLENKQHHGVSLCADLGSVTSTSHLIERRSLPLPLDTFLMRTGDQGSGHVGGRAVDVGFVYMYMCRWFVSLYSCLIHT